MAGKVFISCGQREGREREMAEAVRVMLKNGMFTPYVAIQKQSLDDVAAIINELRSSDYYLFIDFKRDVDSKPDSKDPGLPISLFTHQELALAYHLGFQQNIIALREDGVPRQGLLNYLMVNAVTFGNEEELIDRVRELVEDRGWKPDFSRNLVPSGLRLTEILGYFDHTSPGVYTNERVWQLTIENRRPDVAAVGSVCILNSIMNKADGARITPFDRGYLKWAGQGGYERTILPKDHGIIDICAMRLDRGGLFLHSFRDTPREPILTENGEYRLFYKLYSQGFPLLEFSVDLSLHWAPGDYSSLQGWGEKSSAVLVAQ